MQRPTTPSSRFSTHSLALTRPLLCLLLVVLALAAPAAAQPAAGPPPGGAAAGPPALLRAFGTAATPQLLTYGSRFAPAGRLLFFTVGSGDALTIPLQSELWRSDGTAAGTARLLSLPQGPPGEPSGFIGDLVPVGDSLFFTASTPAEGPALWKSDGTAAGTVPVKHVPGSIERLTNAAGTLFFQADDQLWKSDGTAAGTAPVVSLPERPLITELVAAGGGVFFATLNGASPQELWRSDGTAAGTIRLATFDGVYCGRASCTPASIYGLTPIGSTLYFAGRAGEAKGLWRSDGTPAGTALIGQPLDSAAHLSELMAAGGQLFYVRWSGSGAAEEGELWRSDGTPAGTARLRQFGPLGAGGGSPTGLVAANGALFFRLARQANGAVGQELWRSDGTPAGTSLVASLPADLNQDDARLAPVHAMVLLAAGDDATGVELWESDGTAARTRPLADLAPGAASSEPANLTLAGPRLFFTASGADGKRGLWAMPLASQPFQPRRVGVRAVIPAADYDLGGEGLAYHDLDPFNRRDVYRTGEGVDVEADPAGGYNVAWARAGEWLTYSVDIVSTATYTLELKVASLGPGGTFRVLVDGADRSGPLQVPDTGGWQRWATLRVPGLELGAGRHTLRLVMLADGAEAVGNFKLIALDAASERVYLPQTGR